MKGWCDGNPSREWGCGNPATFAIRYAYGDEIIEACGKHLAAQLESYPITSTKAAFIVVPCNPNTSGLS